MATETPGMVCGPTTGCGQATPMVPTLVHTTGGVENGWQVPAACMHCGKPFSGSARIDNPPPIAALAPWFVFGASRSSGEPSAIPEEPHRVVLACSHCDRVPLNDVRLGEICTSCHIGGYTIPKRERLSGGIPRSLSERSPGFESRCEKTLNEGRHVCLLAKNHDGDCRPMVNAPWPPRSLSEEPDEGVVRCAKCERWHSGVNTADVKTNLCEDCGPSSERAVSDDTKRLDFLQSWCDDMFWTRERNAVGEPRLMLSWFIGDGGSPAFATTGDDWRDAIDQARVKMGDVARSPLSVVDTTRSNVPWLQCPKAPHDKRDGGYLHDENDDRPYDVDGLTYCGRCHFSCNEATQRCEHLANTVPSGRDPGGEG